MGNAFRIIGSPKGNPTDTNSQKPSGETDRTYSPKCIVQTHPHMYGRSLLWSYYGRCGSNTTTRKTVWSTGGMPKTFLPRQ